MNFGQFQEVLLGCLDPNRSVQFGEVIEQFKQNEYPSYINLLLQSISQSDCERTLNTAITLLFNEVRNKNVFMNQEFAFQFLQNFSSIISSVLVSPRISDNFKMIMATILGILHVYIFNINSDTTIPKYILTSYNSQPNIRRYLVHCVFEISVAGSNFGGFSIEDLVKLLNANFDDVSLYSPRVHLFFAIAMNVPDNPTLHEVFVQLLSLCPQDCLGDLLKSMSDFAEQAANFFAPHLAPLVQKLCEIAGSQSFPETYRNAAIICLGSIAQGASEMCQSTEEYYIPVLSTLIQIATEIDDSSPWEYDPNNMQSYQCALDNLGIIFHSLESPKMFIPLHRIIHAVVSNPESTWQAIHAVFASAAEADIITFSYLLDSDKDAKRIMKGFLMEIGRYLNLQVHPRIRLAIYNLILKLTGVILSPDNKRHKIIIVPLQQIAVEETVAVMKKYAYKALNEFFNQTTNQKYNQYFSTLFPMLIQELSSPQDDGVRIYILRCMGHLVKGARDNALDYSNEIMRLTLNQLQSQNPEIRAEAITCFSLAITHMTEQYREKIDRLLIFFYHNAIQLIDNVSEESAECLNEAIHHLILVIGESITPLAPQILKKILLGAQRPIEIEKRSSFSDESMPPSLYLKIPSDEKGIKIYAMKNEVNDVYYSLNILDALICSDTNSANYLEQTLFICRNWICNEYAIEKLQIMCWGILMTVTNRFRDSAILEYMFQCYINSIKKWGSALFISKVMTAMIHGMSVARKCNWGNEQTFVEVLQTLPDLSNYIINMKGKKMQKLAQYNSLDLSNKEIAHFDMVLAYIAELLNMCFSIHNSITGEFFGQLFGPLTESYLADQVTLIFGITLTTTFIIGTHNTPKVVPFIEFLIGTTEQFDRQDDLVLNSFSSMGKLFASFPFGPNEAEIALHYLEFFAHFFQLDQIQNDSEQISMISDFANVAMAKFLQANIDIIDKELAISVFSDAFPLWETPEDSDCYFSFIAYLMEKNLISLISDEWPAIILGQLLSGYITHQYTEETRKRIAVSFDYHMKSKIVKDSVIDTIGRMHENRQKMFNEFLDLNDKKQH